VRYTESDIPGFRLHAPEPKPGLWQIIDSRRSHNPTEWRAEKRSERPPRHVIDDLDKDERHRISEDGIGFMVAAPIDGTGVVMPTDEHLPIHVFYPAERPGEPSPGPVRLLLHAEFLVTSDRTAVAGIDANSLNSWVADRLAIHVCEFIQNAYVEERPSCNIALLLPHEDIERGGVTAGIWERIVRAAKTELRIANAAADPTLGTESAMMVSASVDRARARRLLEGTDIRHRLVHRAFDDDEEAARALRKLGCAAVGNSDVIKAIEEWAPRKADDPDWTWNCWEWLARWIADKPRGQERQQRVQQVRGLPVVPVGGKLCTPASLEGRVVVWRPDQPIDTLPDWLPVTFIDDWFRDRLGEASTDSPEGAPPARDMLKALDLWRADEDVAERALGLAIEQYWKSPKGEPSRFLRFILSQVQRRERKNSDPLCRCPVPVTGESISGTTWAEAREAYFGSAWGNETLAALYAGVEGIVWVAKEGVTEQENARAVMDGLGCRSCPRILSEREHVYAWNLPPAWHKHIQQNLSLPRDTKSNYSVHSESTLDRIRFPLSEREAGYLLVLIAGHWQSYYGQRATTKWGHIDRVLPQNIDARWWYQTKYELTPPMRSGSPKAPLADCFILEAREAQRVGDILPIIDLPALEDGDGVTRAWLESQTPVRTRLIDVEAEEWQVVLQDRIPAKANIADTAADQGLRTRVTGWYESCVESAHDSGKGKPGSFADVPLLCRKGTSWQYISNENRYMADDILLEKAFEDDVWLLSFPQRLRPTATAYFGIPSLAASVDRETVPSGKVTAAHDQSVVSLDATLPYIFAWRQSITKQEADRLRSRIVSFELEIVEHLHVRAVLNGLARQAKRSYGISKSRLLLREADVSRTTLARAVAEALGVPSEADLYECLLACEDNRGRAANLLHRGMSEDELRQALDEYRSAATEPTRVMPSDCDAEPGDSAILGARQPVADDPDRESDVVVDERSKDTGPEEADGEGPAGEQSGQGTKVTGGRPTEGGGGRDGTQSVYLKDPDRTAYRIGGGVASTGRDPTIVASPTNGPSGRSSSLSQEDRNRIEDAGRRYCARRLEEEGYTVESMARDNPGFDLRAVRNGKELRVEAKAHTQGANIVELTRRELNEYRDSFAEDSGYDWQLWNVEYVGSKEHLTLITRFGRVDDRALSTRTYRVDLGSCPAIPPGTDSLPEGNLT
jgi:hypothetical protein